MEHPDWEGEEYGSWESYWNSVSTHKRRATRLEEDVRREWEHDSLEAHADLHGIKMGDRVGRTCLAQSCDIPEHFGTYASTPGLVITLLIGTASLFKASAKVGSHLLRDAMPPPSRPVPRNECRHAALVRAGPRPILLV